MVSLNSKFRSRTGRVLAVISLSLAFVGATCSVLYQLIHEDSDFLIPVVLGTLPIFPLILLYSLLREPIMSFVYFINFPAVWVQPILDFFRPTFPDISVISYDPAQVIQDTLMHLFWVFLQAIILYYLGALLGKLGSFLKK